MLRSWILPLTLLGAFSPIVLSGQVDVSFRLINENLLTYNNFENASKANPNNLLGLNEFEAENRFFPVFTTKYEKLKVQFEPKLLTDPIQEKVTLSVNELYAQYEISDHFFVKLGKERINWGTGNVWNPTNPFLQRDPFRLNNRLEGVVVTDFEFLFKDLNWQIILAPDEDLNSTTLATRLNTNVKATSFSFSYAYLGENRQQVGADFSYGGDNFTFYGEAVARNFSNTALVNNLGIALPNGQNSGLQNPYFEYLLGTMINISSKSQMIAEYRFREDYNTSSSIENFEDHLPDNVAFYDPISMGRGGGRGGGGGERGELCGGRE